MRSGTGGAAAASRLRPGRPSWPRAAAEAPPRASREWCLGASFEDQGLGPEMERCDPGAEGDALAIGASETLIARREVLEHVANPRSGPDPGDRRLRVRNGGHDVPVV